MNDTNEPTNLGLSEDSHTLLKALHQERDLNQMADYYRFAVAYALSKNIKPPDMSGARQNIFSVSTIDPNRELYDAVVAFGIDITIPVYKEIERLADWGIRELFQSYKDGTLDFQSLLNEVQS